MIDTTPAECCAAQPAAPPPDYYYTYHTAQQEEVRPNLCPACNGTGYTWILFCGDEPDPDDCHVCLGEGTLPRPYTERDLWHDQLMLDVHRYRTGVADA